MERPHPRRLTAPPKAGKAQQRRGPCQGSVLVKITEPHPQEGRKEETTGFTTWYFFIATQTTRPATRSHSPLRPRRLPQRPTTGLLHRALVGFVPANKKVKAAVKIEAWHKPGPDRKGAGLLRWNLQHLSQLSLVF